MGQGIDTSVRRPAMNDWFPTRMKTLVRRELRLSAPNWRTAARALIAAIVTIALLGCSEGTDDADVRVANRATSRLSPEQCAAGAQIDEAAAMSGPDGSYLIQPGDQLAVEFYLNPEFNDEVTVRPDGKVTLRAIGDVKAWGQTPAQLADALDKAYQSELRSPDAVVHVKNMPSREVYVQGQVSKPGAFPLEAGMTAVQAVSEAGGLTDDAGGSAVLIRRDFCGQPTGIHVKLAKAMDHPDQSQDVVLMPRDVIVVPRSTIANMDLFVKQYIQGLLPIPPYMSFPGPAL
jgi:protein involved in polysaccharide export with SLBB domain